MFLFVSRLYWLDAVLIMLRTNNIIFWVWVLNKRESFVLKQPFSISGDVVLLSIVFLHSNLKVVFLLWIEIVQKQNFTSSCFDCLQSYDAYLSL